MAKNFRKHLFDPWLRMKVDDLTARMSELFHLYRQATPARQEYYTLKLERELLQIAKHLIFMQDIIKEERAKFNITLSNEVKVVEKAKLPFKERLKKFLINLINKL